MLSWMPAGQRETFRPPGLSRYPTLLDGHETASLVCLSPCSSPSCSSSPAAAEAREGVPSDRVARRRGTTRFRRRRSTICSPARSARLARRPRSRSRGRRSTRRCRSGDAVPRAAGRARAEGEGSRRDGDHKDVDTKLAQIKKQYFGGKEASYQKQLKAQGLTEPQLRLDLHAQILSQKLYDAVTGKLKVTDADITKYYNDNKAQYATAESRDVRHILVNNKKLADSLETQLKKGGDFAALAKKFSKDPGSAKLGGKLTITKGQTVAPFDKVAFSLKTNETSPPVHTQYGWHIIQALSAIKPAKTTPLTAVKSQISQQLLQTKRTAAMTTWLNGVKKDYAKEISYQAGYAPASTATTTTPATTTSQ